MPKNYGWHQVNGGAMGDDMIPLWGARIDGDMRYISVISNSDAGWAAVEKTLPIRTMGLSGAIGRQVISPYFYDPNFKARGQNATLSRDRIIGGQDTVISFRPFSAAYQWAIDYMIKHPGGAI